ncbi:MAG TPA: hypothetical protein VN253_22525 [Kofleriaceae bacterium]|nr:hypothetical protein [Kofleriaceae bacterium]
MEQFSLGKVLGTGFRVWFRNLVPFLAITTIIYAPFLIWALMIVHGNPPMETLGKDLQRLNSASLVLVPLLNILVSSALVYGVVMELKGEHASMFRCLGTGLSRFFPVLGVTLLTMLAVIGGALLLIVPGLIIACMLYVTTGVAVLERPGLFGALARSSALTAGHRWAIFGLLLILSVINYVLTKGTGHLFVLSPQMTETEVRELVQRYIHVDLARAVLVGSLSSVMSSSAYYYLRLEKEGTSAGELARVFE